MRKFSGLPWLFCGLISFASLSGYAQGIFQVPNEEKISRSSLIIEGKVIGKRSYWNESHTMIFTANQVEIYKVFKGNTEKRTIEVVTVGGTVDNTSIHASHLLELKLDDIGVFFCANKTKDSYDVYSSSQGFFKYDLHRKKAFAPFVQYDDIEKGLYRDLKDKTGEPMKVKNSSFDIGTITRGNIDISNSELAPAVSNFSPATVYAGALMDPANNILTINGSGFGSPSGQAAVLFQHADYAPGTQTETVAYNNSSLIISWADNQIKVRVPSKAATGEFTVRHSNGTSANSPGNLNVLFSIITADDLGASYGIKQFNLGNRNSNGGYTVSYSTSTANSGVNINNSPAKQTFQRALTTWKQGTGVNFADGNGTTTQIVDPNDDENIVMFDNGGTGLGTPMAAGVLATCYSSISICPNNPALNQTIKSGFDIVIRNTGYSQGNTAFTLGPCPPYASTSPLVDLETVLLHELGHAMNLGHINDRHEGTGSGTTNPAKVMHYAVSNNLRRISLDYAAIAGGKYQVNPVNYNYGNCFVNPKMVPLALSTEPKDDCPEAFPNSVTARDSLVNFNLALATSNELVDPGYLQMTDNGIGREITNTAFFPIRTNDAGGTLTIDVRNYTTTPAPIADCPVGSLGIQSTGVKMSLYKLSGCPGGGNYPSPIAYEVFTGNGTLPNINNLTANTNYLLVVDGVQNTKAVFDMNFSGTALFTEEKLSFSMKVADNPVRTSPLAVYITNEEPDNYEFVLRDMTGRPISNYKTSVSRGTQRVEIPYQNVFKGIYYLSVYDAQKQRKQTVKVAIINE